MCNIEGLEETIPKIYMSPSNMQKYPNFSLAHFKQAKFGGGGDN